MTEAAHYFSEYPSPIGPLLLIGTADALTGLYLDDEDFAALTPLGAKRDDGVFAEVRKQLDQYFSGELTSFQLTLAAEGSPFQKRVWGELEKIPFAVTDSYGALAERIGNPKASRAVGLANGRNPISIIVPCHRVIGKSGALVGYSSGLERKKWLLDHEARVAADRV